MKHTKGPWEWNSSTRQITGNNDDGCIVVQKMMHQIYDERYEIEEMEANARLIAAAPDLLEALQQIANAVIESRKYPLNGKDALGMVKIAQRAIAKVEEK